ncbi:predicted protein [Postia placenta Mad-698-R]|nr:predicted protein [Postia placenta Mad-698-R]
MVASPNGQSLFYLSAYTLTLSLCSPEHAQRTVLCYRSMLMPPVVATAILYSIYCHGLSLSQAGPSLSCLLRPGLIFWQAQATSSQAVAPAFRLSQALHITNGAKMQWVLPDGSIPVVVVSTGAHTGTRLSAHPRVEHYVAYIMGSMRTSCLVSYHYVSFFTNTTTQIQWSSTQFLWDYQPSRDHLSSSTTEQTAALSPPQKGLPSTLEVAPGVVQPVQTHRSSPIKNLLATTRDTHLLTQKMYSPFYESMLNPYKQQKAHSHPPVNNHSNSLKFTPPAPTNALVEVPMATFTQEDIDQRIAVALAAYQSQQSTANRPLRLDIPAPEPFSGKAEDLRRFIQYVLSYFVATNNTRLSDEAKIAFTVALMKKDLGKTWADAYYEKSAGGVQVYSTWANFVAALEEVFPEHGTRIKAHQILMKLPERQRDRKTALSLGNYVTHFEQLASKAQLKDTEVNGTNRVENDYHTLHANFVKGLPKELYFALATRVARDRPNTMKAWYDEVRNTDTAKQGALVVTDTRDYGEPMDIDAAAVASTFASTSGGRKWELGAVLNEADRKLHRDGNLCFYYHIKGHSAKDCRKKAAA